MIPIMVNGRQYNGKASSMIFGVEQDGMLGALVIQNITEYQSEGQQPGPKKIEKASSEILIYRFMEY